MLIVSGVLLRRLSTRPMKTGALTSSKRALQRTEVGDAAQSVNARLTPTQPLADHFSGNSATPAFAAELELAITRAAVHARSTGIDPEVN